MVAVETKLSKSFIKYGKSFTARICLIVAMCPETAVCF